MKIVQLILILFLSTKFLCGINLDPDEVMKAMFLSYGFDIRDEEEKGNYKNARLEHIFEPDKSQSILDQHLFSYHLRIYGLNPGEKFDIYIDDKESNDDLITVFGRGYIDQAGEAKIIQPHGEIRLEELKIITPKRAPGMPSFVIMIVDQEKPLFLVNSIVTNPLLLSGKDKRSIELQVLFARDEMILVRGKNFKPNEEVALFRDDSEGRLFNTSVANAKGELNFIVENSDKRISALQTWRFISKEFSEPICINMKWTESVHSKKNLRNVSVKI